MRFLNLAVAAVCLACSSCTKTEPLGYLRAPLVDDNPTTTLDKVEVGQSACLASAIALPDATVWVRNDAQVRRRCNRGYFDLPIYRDQSGYVVTVPVGSRRSLIAPSGVLTAEQLRQFYVRVRIVYEKWLWE
jgi:hypothetical protein